MLEYLGQNESELEGIVDDVYVSDIVFSVVERHRLEGGEVTTRVRVSFTRTVAGQCCDMPQSECRSLMVEVVQSLYSSGIELEAAEAPIEPDGDFY